MVKKIVLAVLMALLMASAALAESNIQVVDEAGALSPVDIARLEEIMIEVEEQHQIDLVVLVTDKILYSPVDDTALRRARDYADDYYDEHGCGMGKDASGLLYLIDIQNRVEWISTAGDMITYIDDGRENSIMNATTRYLQDNDWGTAAMTAMKKVGQFMDEGRREGVFIYDEVTGQRMSGIYNPLKLPEVLLASCAGLAVAGVFVFIVSGTYNLSGSTYIYDANKNNQTTFLQNDSEYLRQSVHRIPRSNGSSGSGGFSGGRSGGVRSGSHRSSSGRSHGGGGRRF